MSRFSPLVSLFFATGSLPIIFARMISYPAQYTTPVYSAQPQVSYAPAYSPAPLYTPGYVSPAPAQFKFGFQVHSGAPVVKQHIPNVLNAFVNQFRTPAYHTPVGQYNGGIEIAPPIYLNPDGSGYHGANAAGASSAALGAPGKRPDAPAPLLGNMNNRVNGGGKPREDQGKKEGGNAFKFDPEAVTEDDIDGVMSDELKEEFKQLSPVPIVKDLKNANDQEGNIWNNPFELFNADKWYSPQVYENGQFVQQVPEAQEKKDIARMGVFAPRGPQVQNEAAYTPPARVVAIDDNTAKVILQRQPSRGPRFGRQPSRPLDKLADALPGVVESEYDSDNEDGISTADGSEYGDEDEIEFEEHHPEDLANDEYVVQNGYDVKLLPRLHDIVELNVNDALGTGSYGTVNSGVLKATGEKVAVKMFKNPEEGKPLLTWGDFMANPGAVRMNLADAREECEWAQKIRAHDHPATRLFINCFHTNIGEMDDVLQLPKSMPKDPTEPLFLVLTFAGGEYANVPPNPKNAFTVISQMLEGISFLKDVVGASHHDLKPPNVMYREVGNHDLKPPNVMYREVGNHDLKPPNVMYREDINQIFFIDFGGMMDMRNMEGKRSVCWTPAYAPVEFEEHSMSHAEATISSFDLFSLAGVIGAVLTAHSPIEQYMVNCGDPFITYQQRFMCMVKQKPYYIQWDRIGRHFANKDVMLGEMMQAAASEGVGWARQMEQLILAPQRSSDRAFLSKFIPAWTKMFGAHYDRLQGFEELKQLFGIFESEPPIEPELEQIRRAKAAAAAAAQAMAQAPQQHFGLPQVQVYPPQPAYANPTPAYQQAPVYQQQPQAVYSGAPQVPQLIVTPAAPAVQYANPAGIAPARSGARLLAGARTLAMPVISAPQQFRFY